VVIDSSALAAVAFVEPEAGSVTAAVAGAELYAASLLPYELANTARNKILRRELSEDLAAQGLGRALRVEVELRDVDPPEVFALAIQTNLTAYDASYLWLAMRLGAPLVTLDGELADAARERGLLGI
jgi:predicted nucleic acid-binding protein